MRRRFHVLYVDTVVHISIEECQCMCACVCVCVCVAAHWLCIREKAHICMYISILKASCFNERHGIYKNRTHCCTSSTRQCQYILMAWQETGGAHMGVSTRLPHTYRQFWQKAVACSLFLVAVAVAHVVVVVVVAIPAVVAIAGSRKTRHQFIWPELSLAGLIHFAAVCRWAARGVRLANQTNQMTLSF